MEDDTTVEENVFHHEFGIVVASSSVQFDGARVYIQHFISELMARGDDSSTKVLMLSGCHGFDDGKDALCHIKGIQSVNGDDGKLIQRQTRQFYEAWCDFFQLDVEGEDPRVYDDNRFAL